MNACSTTATATISASFAEVAPDARLAQRHATLTYRVPDALANELEVGQLIWVPLRRTLALGIVVERHDRQPAGVVIKEVHAPVEPTFCLTPLQWQLAVWIAEQTLSTL